MDIGMFGNISLEENETHHFNLGDLHAWIKYREEEIWIAYGYKNEMKGRLKDDAPPAEIEWSRWANKTVSQEIQILPVFPDLPLIVHSEFNLKISPETKIQIYTRIPIWIKVSMAKEDYKLIEMPTIKLSRTWFGSPIEGELCYHATTKARRDLSHVDKKPYLVSCPILISNKSEDELDFGNFCFRVERLTMYKHQEELWADETQIIYHGTDQNSDVIMTGKLPTGLNKKQLLSKPRKEIQKSLATRTFKRIFEDTLTFGR